MSFITQVHVATHSRVWRRDKTRRGRLSWWKASELAHPIDTRVFYIFIELPQGRHLLQTPLHYMHVPVC